MNYILEITILASIIWEQQEGSTKYPSSLVTDENSEKKN